MTLPHAWSPVPGGIRLRVRVTPRGGRDAVEGIGADTGEAPHLKLRIASAPVDGDANEAVIKVLVKWLGVPKTNINIVGGETMRLKTLMITGDPVQLLHRCQILVAPAAA